MSKVLVASTGGVGGGPSVPAIRARHFAEELAKKFDVMLLLQGRADGVQRSSLRVVEEASLAPRAFERMIAGFDVVVAHGLPFPPVKRLARARARVIYDLYVPVLTEYLGMLDAEQPSPVERRFAEWALLGQRFALATGDAFICPSERQRDLWVGTLAALGRVDLALYREDRTLRNLIDVVPFGLPAEPPASGAPVLKGVHPGIGEEDRVLLWVGGLWNWLDPLTPIRAVGQLASRRADVKLVFLGFQHPRIPQHAMAHRALALAEELGLRDRFVFFKEGWVPYEERQRFLLEADLGVSAHFDTLETRYAFRTRLLDHFWAGLPTVTTRGDELAELVERRGLGRAVDYGDVEGWVRAIAELLGDEAERAHIARNLQEVRAELAWPRVVEPLVRLVGLASSSVRRGKGTWAMGLEDRRLRMKISLRLGGPAGVLRRQARKLARLS